MHILYLLTRTYPYYAVPFGLVIGELGIHFRRTRNRLEIFCWIGVITILVGLVFWLIFRGDLHSAAWVRFFF